MRKLLTSKRIRFALFIFLCGTVSGILNTLVVISTALANQEKFYFSHPLLWELTGSYSFVLLIPIMIYLFKKLPLSRGKLLRHIPIYIVVVFILGIIHTAVMYYSRTILYDLLNWGIYDYGYIPYRYIMETIKLSIGFGTVFAIYIVVNTNKEKQQVKVRAVKLEEELAKTKLEFLKGQINPHFLFNTLNMISSTMYENVETADKMIANLSDLLRTTLKSSKNLHTLKEEVDVLNLYLEIMRARFGNKLSVEFAIDEETEMLAVPAFLLQPIVENSIKHGMENLSSTKIIITASIRNDKLEMSIIDNGPGINLESNEALAKGIGFSNIQKRLEQLFGNNFEFVWENLPQGGLAVRISIPIEEQYEQQH